MVIKGWEGGIGYGVLMGMVTSIGHGVSFVGDEKVLEVDSDEAYTTLRIK